MAVCSACGTHLTGGAAACHECGQPVDETVARRTPSATQAAPPLGNDLARLAVGQRFGADVVEAIIGGGGMGVVYRAGEPRVGRQVALKVIRPGLARDASFRERFKREVRLAASIEHPNVVPVYHAGE
jgi:hypothetical protein